MATFFFHVTQSRVEAEELLAGVLAPGLDRDREILANRLAIGPPELLTERLTALREAGAQRVYLWPLRDHLTQLELARGAWPA